MANNDICIAILKSVAQRNSCRRNLIGDRNLVGEIAGGLGISSLSADQRRDGHLAFDWLLANDFVRLTNDNPVPDWIEIADKGQAALQRGRVRDCDIFISHAAVDARLGLKLKAELEKRVTFNGTTHAAVRCFCSSDPTDLPPGAEWPKEIQEALQSAVIFLLVVSSGSLVRPWVWFEVGSVWFRTDIRIVPLCFGGQELGKLPPPWNVKQAIRGTDFASVFGGGLNCAKGPRRRKRDAGRK